MVFIQYSIRSLKREEGIKSIQMERDNVKLSIFTEDVTLYREEPRNVTKRLLKLTRKFCIPVINSLAYKNLYKKEIIKAFQFTTDVKRRNKFMK